MIRGIKEPWKKYWIMLKASNPPGMVNQCIGEEKTSLQGNRQDLCQRYPARGSFVHDSAREMQVLYSINSPDRMFALKVAFPISISACPPPI